MSIKIERIKLYLKGITHNGGINNLYIISEDQLIQGKIYYGVLTPEITDPITLAPLPPSYIVECEDGKIMSVDASFFLTMEELRENKLIELDMTIEEYNNGKFCVSEKFANIFKYFNVYDKIDMIKSLDNLELLLLLNLCVEKHDLDDPIVISNFKPFDEELHKLYVIRKDIFSQVGENELINKLIDYEYYYKLDNNVCDMPKIFSKNEVREIRLNNIFDK